MLGAQTLLLCFDDGKMVCVDFRDDHRNVGCPAVRRVVGDDRDLSLCIGFLELLGFVFVKVDCTENDIDVTAGCLNVPCVDDDHVSDTRGHFRLHLPSAAEGFGIGLAGRARACRQLGYTEEGMVFQKRDKTLSYHAGCADNAGAELLFNLHHDLYPPFNL